jgi:hypothetical protein
VAWEDASLGGAGPLLGRDAELRRLDGVLGAVDRRGAVGSHLYHAFPKLGITSRGELAGVLGDDGGGGPTD